MRNFLSKLLLYCSWKLGRKAITREEKEAQKIYQNIGEFIVCFQWLEFRLREIGLILLDHENLSFGKRMELLNISNEKLIKTVEELFVKNIKYCYLPKDFEKEFIDSFQEYSHKLHKVRQYRNEILHSTYLEINSHGTILGMFKKDNKKLLNDGLAKSICYLNDKSYYKELRSMGEIAIFLNRCKSQLLMRYKITDEYTEYLKTQKI